jgi:putative ABC transport system substrate-binding protein
MSYLRRRDFIGLIGGAVAWPVSGHAQVAGPSRIGALVLSGADAQSLTRQLRYGLRDVGYVEGRNFIFEVRSADGDVGRLGKLAEELVRLPVDIIVATFTPCALAAQRATTTIPIVMAAVADPIGSGLVQSLARPGGNITGFSNMAAETAGKGVELLRDMLPSLSRVAVLANPADPFTKPFLEQVHLAGRTSGIEIAPVAMARGPEEIEDAVATIAKAGAHGLVVQGIFFSQLIADLTMKHRLPPHTAYYDAQRIPVWKLQSRPRSRSQHRMRRAAASAQLRFGNDGADCYGTDQRRVPGEQRSPEYVELDGCCDL